MTIEHQDLVNVVSRLRADPDLNPERIERVFRRLVLQVHPDHRHGDGELFLYLQEQFETLRRETLKRRATNILESDLDPYRLARDLGITRTLTPREALYVGLYRFRGLGLTSWRIRVRPDLRARNSRIIRTILYWGRRYDEHFVPAFQELLRHPGRFLLSEHQASLYFLVRRTMLRGLDWLVLYQERGRPATGEIARDTLQYALSAAASRKSDLPFAALVGMIEWMLAELEQPPLNIRMYR